MEPKKDREFDSFLKKAIKEAGLESPSHDFTDLVMAKIDMEKARSPKVVYSPLISKSVWWLLALVVVGMFAYVLLGNSNTDIGWMTALKLNSLAEFNLLTKIPDVSDTFAWGMVGLAIFLYLQILFLKRHFHRRYV